MSDIAKKRIPVENVIRVNNIIKDRQSNVRGYITPEGINTGVHLYLQDTRPKSHLKCYEVEIFSLEGRLQSPDTPEIAPESFWQDDENHYCMTDRYGSYPLVPIPDLDRISKLTLDIGYRGNSPKMLLELLSGLSLSIDGSNPWFAKGPFEGGTMELLHNPEWGEDRAALVYTRGSPKIITPHQVYTAAQGMNDIGKTLTERLVA